MATKKTLKKTTAPEIKGEPAAGSCGIDVSGRQAKPDQHGCRIAISGTVLLGLLAAKHF